MSLDPSETEQPQSTVSPAAEPRLLTRRDTASTVSPRAQRRAPFSFRRFRPAHLPRPNLRVRFWLRRLSLSALALVALLILGTLIYAITLRHALQASLPQIDGTLHIAGLSAPVTVARDPHGVPSIQAANLDDLVFAQGFVTAQDRLWQMDTLRRHAAGTLAEILGGKLIQHDRMERTLQLRAAADRAAAALPPDQLHQLEGYARGVNAFIAASMRPNADHLPVEFHILHYHPAPWTPRDSLLVSLAMAQDLGTEFPTKLDRETLSAHLAPDLIADLYPVGSWRDHPPGETAPDLTSPKPEIDQIPLDDSQSRLAAPTATPAELLSTRASLLQQTCDACRSGSNNWAVAGTRSASGMPLVSNDMHLSLAIPDIWYEASLHTADGSLEVAGLTLPGTPFVIVGRNAHVAWGFTNLGGDVQDVYIEHLRGTGSTAEFQRPDGSWAPVEHHAEHIRVRGGSDISLDVQTTTHSIGATTIPTPIISPLYPSERRTLSLGWIVYDPVNVTSPMLAANQATDGPSLVASLANFGGPSLNLVYADDRNHIGFHAIGRIPVRGPAVQHPVATPDDVPPPATGPAPADEDQPTETGGSAAPVSWSPPLIPGPSPIRPYRTTQSPARLRFITASLHLPLAPPFLLSSRSEAKRPAVRPTRPHPRRDRAPRPKKQPAPQPEPDPIPAPPEPPRFTIGSPIPALPVDALDPAAQWSGYVPYAALPAVVDPASGVLATANARITPDGYPYGLALDWASPYRVERINHLLAAASGLTSADMLRTEMDIHSEFDLALAHRIAYALDQAAPQARSADNKRLRQAADILRQWNGEVDAGSAAPTIVANARYQVQALIIPAKIAEHDRAFGTAAAGMTPEAISRLYSWGEEGFAIEQLVLHAPARWLPAGVRNWNDLLATAVLRGLATGHAPSDLSTWSYGKLRPVEFNHPLFSLSPVFSWLLGVRTGSGPRVVGGDTYTIKATTRSFGASERFTADLGSPDSATSNITTGQSGNPASPWYLDQLPAWLGGSTFPLPLRGAPAAHVLVLRP